MVYRLPDGFTPAVDGDLSEWSDVYFIDSLRSDDNVYYRDSETPWSAADFQYHLYMAWDSDWVYFAAKVTSDDDPMNDPSAGAWSTDNMKINPGGQGATVYLTSDGRVVPNPSCPYTPGTTFHCGINTFGNGPFPTYEFSIAKSIVDPFGMNMFTLSPGSEENDAGGSDVLYCCVGVEYLGNKTDDAVGPPPDNPLYYPRFDLGDSIPASVETPFRKSVSINVFPNPFCATTEITIFTGNPDKGTVGIYNIKGERVFSRHVEGQGRVRWEADARPSGVYLLRIEAGQETYSRKLLLQK
jgi:hypothetical protein